MGAETRSIPACAGEPPHEGARRSLRGVYPRVCGGTAYRGECRHAKRGLSPRVRGNQRPSPRPGHQRGSIPACAGEPPPGRGRRRWRWVYPRVCGGTTNSCAIIHDVWGLSPRVRGNLNPPHQVAVDDGSIPACAGEPPAHIAVARIGWVYPRVCGGTDLVALIELDRLGLSPRVRGNLGTSCGDSGKGGSIPACAGEPPVGAAARAGGRVYPRVCGGTCTRRECRLLDRGLSPRVRGNPVVFSTTKNAKGSIPACAGEPPSGRRSFQRTWVYPRVCGGTAAARDADGLLQGLSPRVRGNPGGTFYGYAPIGSIPACAGEPGRAQNPAATLRVYPRVCGGTPPSRSTRLAKWGLSPRVRGNHKHAAHQQKLVGSIPACAGEPAVAGVRGCGFRVYPRVCGGTETW